MTASVTAVYPGTFDPLTRGHQDLAQRACGLFDQVVVAVAAAHHKKTLFTLDERLALAREALAGLPRVSVEPFDGLVRDFVMARGAQVMLRGVRGVVDFEYEAGLAGMNKHLMPGVETVFLLPSAALQHISSTLVREIARLGGPEVRDFVAPHVYAALRRKMTGRPPS